MKKKKTPISQSRLNIYHNLKAGERLDLAF